MVTLGEQDVRARYPHAYAAPPAERWRPYLALKRAIDVALALVLGLVIFLPLVLIVAPIVLADGGPLFYAQRRIGAGGRRFPCYKFRSMVPDADRVLAGIFACDPVARLQWEQNHKLGDDPRVTWIGRFLRRSSLDELPQLWNVLRGEMSLVGPRPIVDDEVRRYGRYIARYMARRPGLTGVWQVHGRNQVVDYRRRVAMDVWYTRQCSFALDAVLVLQTVAVVLSGRGL